MSSLIIIRTAGAVEAKPAGTVGGRVAEALALTIASHLGSRYCLQTLV